MKTVSLDWFLETDAGCLQRCQSAEPLSIHLAGDPPTPAERVNSYSLDAILIGVLSLIPILRFLLTH